MQHTQRISRHQLQMSSLEDKITADNPVRFINAFVNHIDTVKIGFQPKVLKPQGRPGFQSENLFNQLENVLSFPFYFLVLLLVKFNKVVFVEDYLSIHWINVISKDNIIQIFIHLFFFLRKEFSVTTIQ